MSEAQDDNVTSTNSGAMSISMSNINPDAIPTSHTTKENTEKAKAAKKKKSFNFLGLAEELRAMVYEAATPRGLSHQHGYQVSESPLRFLLLNRELNDSYNSWMRDHSVYVLHFTTATYSLNSQERRWMPVETDTGHPSDIIVVLPSSNSRILLLDDHKAKLEMFRKIKVQFVGQDMRGGDQYPTLEEHFVPVVANAVGAAIQRASERRGELPYELTLNWSNRPVNGELPDTEDFDMEEFRKWEICIKRKTWRAKVISESFNEDEEKGVSTFASHMRINEKATA